MDNPAELLERCIARIVGNRCNGTAFFVAPGKLLTCAHVIEDADGERTEFAVEYREHLFDEVTVIWSLKQPFPDLALISVPFTDHGCAPLGPEITPMLGDRIFSYGYPVDMQQPDNVILTPMHFEYRGAARSGFDRYYSVNGDSVKPGVSGAPMLCLRTWKVFGVLKHTDHEVVPVGGRGVGVVEATAWKPSFHDDLRIAGEQSWRAPDPEDAVEICPDPVYVDHIERHSPNPDGQSEVFWGIYNGPVPNSPTFALIDSAKKTSVVMQEEIASLQELIRPAHRVLEGFDFVGYGFFSIEMEGQLTIRNNSKRALMVEMDKHTECAADPNILGIYRKLIPIDMPWISNPNQIKTSFGPRGDSPFSERILPNDECSLLFSARFWIDGSDIDDEAFAKIGQDAKYISEFLAGHALAEINNGTVLHIGAALRVSSKPARRNVSLLLSLANSLSPGRTLPDVTGFLERWHKVREAGKRFQMTQFP